MIFRLKPPRRFSPRLGLGLFPVVLLLFWGAQDLLPAGAESWPILLALLALTLAVPAVISFFSRRPGVLQIELGARGVTLPVGPSPEQVAEVAYTDVQLLLLLPNALLIATPARQFLFSASDFEDQRDPVRLHQELGRRIAALPDGEVRLRALEREARAAAEVGGRPAHLSRLIVGVLSITFALELAGGLLQDSPFALVRFGAGSRTLIAQGELFRLVSAGLLHANLLHILLNTIAIISIGGLIERLLGPWAFLVIYWVAALAGAGASAALNVTAFSVGASTAAFGLLGALAYISYHFQDTMPLGFKQSAGWWAAMVGINFLLPIFVPMIDVAGHAGGFLAGLLVTGILVGGEKELPLPARPGIAHIAPAIAVLVLVVAGAERAVANYFDPDPAAVYRALDPLVSEPGVASVTLNRYAWEVAIDPGAEPQTLRRARDAVEKGLVLAPRELEELRPQPPPEERAKANTAMREAYQDTLATLHHRLGERDRAIELEREVLEAGEGEDRRVFATQLARFVRAQVQADPPADVELSRLGGDLIRYTLAAAPPLLGPGHTIYAPAEREGIITGLIRIPFASGSSRTGTVALALPWSDVTLGPGRVLPGERPARVWEADPTILPLP